MDSLSKMECMQLKSLQAITVENHSSDSDIDMDSNVKATG
jgi:hypothetical protein